MIKRIASPDKNTSNGARNDTNLDSNEMMKRQKRRPLIGLVGCFIVGIVLSPHAHAEWRWPVAMALLFLFLFWVLRARPVALTILWHLLFVGFGLFYTTFYASVPGDHVAELIGNYSQNRTMIKGRVIWDPDRQAVFNTTKTSFLFDVDQIYLPGGWERAQGKLLVNVFRAQDVFYGDYLQIEGKLHRPYNFSDGGSFSYETYLKNKGIRGIFSVKKDAVIVYLKRGDGNFLLRMIFHLRQHWRQILNRYLSPPEASLMRMILLGDRANFPEPIRQLFVLTGTVHVLAISGLNIGIVAALFILIVRLLPLGHKGQIIFTIILLIAYAFLTGAWASVVRATVMAVIVLAGLLLERQTDTLNILAVTAWVMLLFNPFYLFDIGFELSFICVFIIVVVMDRWPLLREGILKNPFLYYLLSSTLISFAAWIGVAGLVAYYFQIVTPVTIVANLLIVPLLTFIIVLGFGLMLLGGIYAPGALLFANCIKVVLNLAVSLAFLFSNLPGAYFYFKNVTQRAVCGYYFIFVFIVLWLVHKSKDRRTIDKARRV